VNDSLPLAKATHRRLPWSSAARPKLPLSIRLGDDRSGLLTGHGPGRLAEWQLSDFPTGRKQLTGHFVSTAVTPAIDALLS